MAIGKDTLDLSFFGKSQNFFKKLEQNFFEDQYKITVSDTSAITYLKNSTSKDISLPPYWQVTYPGEGSVSSSTTFIQAEPTKWMAYRMERFADGKLRIHAYTDIFEGDMYPPGVIASPELFEGLSPCGNKTRLENILEEIEND